MLRLRSEAAVGEPLREPLEGFMANRLGTDGGRGDDDERKGGEEARAALGARRNPPLPSIIGVRKSGVVLVMW